MHVRVSDGFCAPQVAPPLRRSHQIQEQCQWQHAGAEEVTMPLNTVGCMMDTIKTT